MVDGAGRALAGLPVMRYATPGDLYATTTVLTTTDASGRWSVRRGGPTDRLLVAAMPFAATQTATTPNLLPTFVGGGHTRDTAVAAPCGADQMTVLTPGAVLQGSVEQAIAVTGNALSGDLDFAYPWLDGHGGYRFVGLPAGLTLLRGYQISDRLTLTPGTTLVHDVRDCPPAP